MNIKNGIRCLFRAVYESETVSFPYIVDKNGVLQLALFSYRAVGQKPVRIYGFYRELFYDGNAVSAEKRELFQTEEEQILIHQVPTASWDAHQALCNAYYDALQRYADEPTAENAQAVSECFCAVTPPEAVEMYRRICPEFVTLLGL